MGWRCYYPAFLYILFIVICFLADIWNFCSFCRITIFPSHEQHIIYTDTQILKNDVHIQ